MRTGMREILYRLGLVRIRPMELIDHAITGQRFSICRSRQYLIINVGSNSLYIDALTGEIDGTGQLLCGDYDSQGNLAGNI